MNLMPLFSELTSQINIQQVSPVFCNKFVGKVFCLSVVPLNLKVYINQSGEIFYFDPFFDFVQVNYSDDLIQGAVHEPIFCICLTCCSFVILLENKKPSAQSLILFFYVCLQYFVSGRLHFLFQLDLFFSASKPCCPFIIKKSTTSISLFAFLPTHNIIVWCMFLSSVSACLLLIFTICQFISGLFEVFSIKKLFLLFGDRKEIFSLVFSPKQLAEWYIGKHLFTSSTKDKLCCIYPVRSMILEIGLDDRVL